jgi:C4-dicarboxylate transporter DctM subunit
VISNTSLGKLFIAGVIPGLLYGVMLGIYTFYYSVKHKISNNEPFMWKGVIQTTKETIWALGAPVLILGGIYSGVFTPTEASGVVSIYALVVSCFIYKDLGWAELWQSLINTAALTAKIFLIVGAASIFAWLLNVGGALEFIKELFNETGLNSFQTLLIINVVFLLAGMVLDPNSAILILLPLCLPVVKMLGIDLIHFGIIITINLSIGMFSIPFGLNLFVTSSIFNEPITTIYRGVIPFFLISLITLLLVTYVPIISTWLPGLM